MKRVLAFCFLAAAAFGQLMPSGGSATTTTNLTQIGGNSVVTGGSNGSLGVGGLAAVGATAVGNPLQDGGVFNTTPATLTNGQAGSLQLSSAQDLLVKVNVPLPAGSNTIGGVTQASGPWTNNLTQIGGNTILTGNGVTGTGSPRVTIASDNTPFALYTIPKTACANTVFSQAWVAVPTANTAATSTTTCVDSLQFTNTNGSAQTITVTDNQGSPITAIATFSIPANSSVFFPMKGTQLTSGIKWQAGGTGITGAILGYQ